MIGCGRMKDLTAELREMGGRLRQEAADALEQPGEYHPDWHSEYAEALVHLAQQFTLDHIRDQGMADVDKRTGQPLYRIPETLE